MKNKTTEQEIQRRGTSALTRLLGVRKIVDWFKLKGPEYCQKYGHRTRIVNYQEYRRPEYPSLSVADRHKVREIKCTRCCKSLKKESKQSHSIQSLSMNRDKMDKLKEQGFVRI